MDAISKSKEQRGAEVKFKEAAALPLPSSSPDNFRPMDDENKEQGSSEQMESGNMGKATLSQRSAAKQKVARRGERALQLPDCFCGSFSQQPTNCNLTVARKNGQW